MPASPPGARLPRRRRPRWRTTGARTTPTVAHLREVVDQTSRGLDDRTREIVKTVILVCVRATDERIEEQMRRALAAGASARDLLEAIEVIITPAGLPVFDAGLAIWAHVTGAKPLEPEIDAPYSRAPAKP
jgi:alkylhydroperoxidase/carboxymuconolactone decarboxylase family protein YurZ